jgi:single-stranded-DNA-specific exonuclease
MLPVIAKRWILPEPPPPEVETALAEFPELFRHVLYNRGVRDIRSAQIYLEALPPKDSPFNLLGVPEAVNRILWAIDNREKIAVYGDYDVDGVTATALLCEVLTMLGANVRSHIPNRFDEGYGLNNDALTALANDGVDLVITVDCGIRSPDEAIHAQKLGIDLIISDHHHPGSEIPIATAVINPKQAGDPYPDKDLSGVGLAYKIAQALLEKRPSGAARAEDWLDLVALGTISDVVPLIGENRALVRGGLERLRQGRRQGVVSLAGAAGVKLPVLSAGDVGFMLGPRLNAAGRLESAQAALQLLMEKDVMATGHLAQRLDQHNRDRQALTRSMQEQAVQMTEGLSGEIVFAFSPTFNAGVVGLVAARLVETFYRPAIVGHIENEVVRASCRSIPEFHITHALDLCQDILVRHGGHAVAAGFTVLLKDLPELQTRLGAIALDELSGRDLAPSMFADAEIDLAAYRPDDVARLIRYLDLLQPAGQDNPEAAFISRGLRVVRSRTVGADDQHLKLAVSSGRAIWDAIAFRQGKWAGAMPAYVDLLYTFERNLYNGNETLQLNVRDLKPAVFH